MPEFRWQQQSEECKQMNSNQEHIFMQHQIRTDENSTVSLYKILPTVATNINQAKDLTS